MLSNIHNKISLLYGSMNEELVEQQLSCKYIKESNVVLEIGGNMGRNALVISNILEKDNNLVTLEPNKFFYEKLIKNRNNNNKNFIVENSCLSINPVFILDSRSFLENKISDIFPISSKELDVNKSSPANIINFNELSNKYNLNFDTLCVDCEGAFYYILQDMSYIIENIKLIIIENDYENIEHYNYVESILKINFFKCVETIPLSNPPWNAPCKDFFYQVWKK
jgi:FkbM family methyltransferase